MSTKYCIRHQYTDKVFWEGNDYRVGCIVAAFLRHDRGDDTIGLVDNDNGRYMSEVIA